MRTIAALTCFAALLAAGCANRATPTARGTDSSLPRSATPPGIVPWVDAPASPYVDPTAPPAPTNARPCRATDLIARPPGHFGIGLGNTNFEVELVVRARTPCVLLGYPTLTGVAADGAATIHVFHGSYFGDPGEPGITGPGQTAAVNISSADACDQLQRGAHRKYPIFRIGLPHGGGSIDVPSHGFDLECGAFVSRFGVPADQPYPQQQWLTATAALPRQVRAGSIVRFVVTLRNTRATAYPLTPCPAYQEALYARSAQVDRYYRLNCTGVHAIPAHGAVSFAMQLSVPAAMAGAAVKFGWDLQDPFPYYLSASLGGVLTVLS